MPGVVVEHLSHTMTHKSRRRYLKTGLFPQSRQANRIIPAGIVSVDVEHLHGTHQFVVVTFKVKTILNLLPPQREGFFLVSHSWLNRAGHDRTHAAEVIATVRQP